MAFDLDQLAQLHGHPASWRSLPERLAEMSMWNGFLHGWVRIIVLGSRLLSWRLGLRSHGAWILADVWLLSECGWWILAQQERYRLVHAWDHCQRTLHHSFLKNRCGVCRVSLSSAGSRIPCDHCRARHYCSKRCKQADPDNVQGSCHELRCRKCRHADLVYKAAKAQVRRECAWCGVVSTSKLKLKKCSRCRACYYCSKSCQESDWQGHKGRCQCTKWFGDYRLDYAFHMVVDGLGRQHPMYTERFSCVAASVAFSCLLAGMQIWSVALAICMSQIIKKSIHAKIVTDICRALMLGWYVKYALEFFCDEYPPEDGDQKLKWYQMAIGRVVVGSWHASISCHMLSCATASLLNVSWMASSIQTIVKAVWPFGVLVWAGHYPEGDGILPFWSVLWFMSHNSESWWFWSEFRHHGVDVPRLFSGVIAEFITYMLGSNLEEYRFYTLGVARIIAKI